MKESMSVISLMGRLGIEIDLPVPVVVDVSPEREPVIKNTETVSFSADVDVSGRRHERALTMELDEGHSCADDERLVLVDLQCKTNLAQKQIAVPDPEEMPAGVSCPFCASRSWFGDPGGCRCAECSRLAWVTLPSGGIVRADFANVAL